MQVPSQLLTTKVTVETTIKHHPRSDHTGDDDYLWSDPFADIVKAVKTVLGRHKLVTDVTVRVSGDTSNLSLDFSSIE